MPKMWKAKAAALASAMARADVTTGGMLATAAGISRGTAHKVQRGDPVSFATVVSVAYALDVDVNDVFIAADVEAVTK